MREISRESDSPPKLSFAAQTGDFKLPKKIDFFSLPRPVQDRFLSSAHRLARPLPILFVPAKRLEPYAWIAGAVVAVVAAIVVTRLGFGDWASALAHQRAPFVGIYGILFAAAAFAGLRAITIFHRPKTLPFPSGTYVFPSSVIDATTHQLRVWTMRDLESVDLVPTPLPTFNFTFTGGEKLSIRCADIDKAHKAEAALTAARQELAKALEEEGPRSMANVDPLFGGSVGSPIGPTEPLVRVVPLWVRLGWLGAVALGLVLAPVVWHLRNASSDAKMFADVQAANTVTAYKAYLAQGGSRSGEVASTLLPRAELKEAEQLGSVDALIVFAKSHRGSKIDSEIAASLRKAMLGELDKAKGEGTVTALKAFSTRYPDHKVDAEYVEALRALYMGALDKYKAAAPEKDGGQAAAFMQRVLGVAAKSGSPIVEVRFRLRPSKSLANADEGVKKSKYFLGDSSLPSRYFAVSKLSGNEADLAKALVDKIAETFPADVLAAKLGDRIDGDALPAFKVPTIVVDYAAEWSRTQTVSTKPRGVYVGVNMQFEIGFYLPDNKQPPLKVQTTAWKNPELWKFKDVSDDRESKIYDAMVDTAFAQAQQKALELLFKMPPAKK